MCTLIEVEAKNSLKSAKRKETEYGSGKCVSETYTD